MLQSDLKLMVRLPNWVGDVIMALPALTALKACGIDLKLLGKPWARELLSGTNLPAISLEQNLWQTARKIARIKSFKHLLLLTNSFSSAFMGRLAMKTLVGYKADTRQFLLKKALDKPPLQHEVETFWKITHFAVQTWFPELTFPETPPAQIHLPLNETNQTNVNTALKKAGVSPPFWVICPFAHGRGEKGQSKCWPHWQALVNALTPDYPLVICPAKNEEALCIKQFPKAIMLPDLNLGEYAAVLAKADKVIANDSGPMHLATAVGADTLGIFGVSNPKRVSPWGGKFIGDNQGWPDLNAVKTRLTL